MTIEAIERATRALSASLEAVRARDAAPEQRRFTAPAVLELKAATAEAGRTIEGYGSVFNVVDSFGETIKPGAFASSLARAAAVGRMPMMLWQHDQSTLPGVWRTMGEDDRGLWVSGELAGTRAGDEAAELLRLGVPLGLSVGFKTVPNGIEEDAAGRRSYVDLDLWEVSIVTFPANRDARIEEVRSVGTLPTARELERILRDAGYSRTRARSIVKVASDEARDAASVVPAIESLIGVLRAR